MLKENFNMKTKRLLSIILVVLLCLTSFCACSKKEEEPEEKADPFKIAYIPLDNRPVNKERAEYLAQSAGFELLMPEEDLYRTALDNMDKNSDGSTFGNREKLLEWVKSVESECDNFVISLDQMFSGGLVSSRWLSNEDLSLETEIADYLIELSKDNYVVYFDTVMRLASTIGYQGYELDEYNKFRSYGMIERKELTGDDLTVENIIEGYRYNKHGKEIETDVTDEQLNQYLSARERKLKVIDYLLTNAVDDIEHIYIGVDDSSPNANIQTNEKNYIKKIGGDNLKLFTGADELGLMGIAAVVSKQYGSANCEITYYGDGKDKVADGFDSTTLAQTIENHLSAIGANADGGENALQILVLTNSKGTQYHAKLLINQLKENLKNGVPTCVINASATESNWGILGEGMFSEDIEIARLLGYSNWNTVSNAVGISLSNSISRYLYINNAEEVSEESNAGFLKTITFSFVKDLSYKAKLEPPLNFTDKTEVDSPASIVEKVNASEILVEKGESASHKAVALSNFRTPWNRTFEATFDITVG